MNMHYAKSQFREMYIDETMFGENISRQDARREVLMGELMQAIGKRKCAKVGHKLEDNSYGGPETGCVSLHCNRCGYSYHVTLY